MPPSRDLTVAATLNTYGCPRSFARSQPRGAHESRLSRCLSGWYESQIHHRRRLSHRRGIARLRRHPERKTGASFRTAPRQLHAHRGPAEDEQHHSEHQRPLAAISHEALEDVPVCSRRREEAENVDARSIRLLTSAATLVGENCRLAGSLHFRWRPRTQSRHYLRGRTPGNFKISPSPTFERVPSARSTVPSALTLVPSDIMIVCPRLRVTRPPSF